jgi:hypothetical protein
MRFQYSRRVCVYRFFTSAARIPKRGLSLPTAQSLQI